MTTIPLYILPTQYSHNINSNAFLTKICLVSIYSSHTSSNFFSRMSSSLAIDNNVMVIATLQCEFIQTNVNNTAVKSNLTITFTISVLLQHLQHAPHQPAHHFVIFLMHQHCLCCCFHCVPAFARQVPDFQFKVQKVRLPDMCK